MKKMYKYILIITLMMFGFVGEVRADSTTYCRYVAESNDDIIEIKKETKGINKLFNMDELYVYVNNKNIHIIDRNYTIGATAYDSLGEECPAKVYWRKDGPSYCFDNDDGHCTTKFTYKDDEGNVGLKGEIENVFKTNGGSEISVKASVNDCVTKGTCKPLCYYADENISDYAIIYYFPEENKFKTSFSWKENNKVYDLNTESGTAFIGIDEKKDLKNAICPNYIYKDENWNDEDEVCFDSDGEYCVGRLSGHFDISEKLTNITPKTLLSYDDLQKLLMDNLECDEALEEILKISNNDKIYDICSYKKNLDGGGEVDQIFIVNYNNKYDIFRYSKNSSGVFEFKKTDIRSELTYEISCTEYGEIYLNDVVTKNYQTDSNGQCIEINSNSYKYFSEKKLKNTTGFGCSPSTINNPIHYQYPDLCKVEKNEEGELVIIDNCNDLLGDSLISEINSYLLYIKIAVPIIIIVMGSIDFGTAFIASDEDKMKKAQKKFIMRLIIGMVIFFIPSIINALLKIANDVWGIFGGSCDVGF